MMEEQVTEPDEALPPGEQSFRPLEGPVSVVLGRLYLGQGHFDDAQEVFEALLARDHGDEEARAGIRAVRKARVRARKLARLRQFLERIESGLLT